MKKQFSIAGLVILLITGSALLLSAAGTNNNDELIRLGMYLYKDQNLSLYQNQSCQTCHHPLAGFADPTNLLDPDVNFVSMGSDGQSLGGRNAPTSAYAGYSPIRYQDANGDWFGGMFWDGRMDGSVLGDPLAEQAQGPPLNPVEMAMESEEAVLAVIKSSDYYPLWIKVYGPIKDTDEAWEQFARAVAAYERSAYITKFTSKFDLARNQYTAAEKRGLGLFRNHCSTCHPTTAALGAPNALFTTYGYVNIGVPANPVVPSPDLGLGEDVGDPDQDGKFKIPTLRNIAVTAPYSHNGGFPTLYDMVSFINDSSGFTPDVSENVVDSKIVGDLKLTEDKIEDLIAFLKTLTDDY